MPFIVLFDISQTTATILLRMSKPGMHIRARGQPQLIVGECAGANKVSCGYGLSSLETPFQWTATLRAFLAKAITSFSGY